ncbi:hypothetical protein G7046_g1682 [Stylonectria norvegica]|nr:hypothetical protein G7046_g1682 [Stylonectria norvegica]
MSPHAVRQASPRRQLSSDLSRFFVTKNAFLPEESPSKLLSDPYYDPWEVVAQHLPSLIENGIRRAVEQLPLLSTDRLRSEDEWRRAYVMLAFITHAYVWGGEKPEEVRFPPDLSGYGFFAMKRLTIQPKILPPQITVPFLAVSAHHELPPVLTYAAANLWNFSCTSDEFTNLEDLRSLITFTGTESESWFLLISVAMEAKAGAIIPYMAEALDAVKVRDYPVIISALNELRQCIEGVGELLERMYEKCDPMVFYQRIRPFLAGSKNMEAAGLPRGVFYDEGNGKGEWQQYRGGSNGQSSLIQFFDVVLGVEHNTNGSKGPSTGERSFHEQVRDYMPGPHRRFLVHIARMGSIRELAMLPSVTEQQTLLREAYTAATDALSEFRTKHIQIVTRYIILPSRQAALGTRQNLASSSTRKGGEELTGTGGTTLVPFLKQSRDETSNAGKLER